MNWILKTAGVVISVLLLSGCLSQYKTPDTDHPVLDIKLQKIDLIQYLTLNPSSYEIIPLLSQRISNKVACLNINESGIIVDDLSLFSSRFAITFWNDSNDVFVVETYTELLLVSPLAKMLNTPVLVYGNTTEAILRLLKTNKVISIGNVPIGDIRLKTRDILEYQLSRAKEIGVDIDYLALVNTNDSSIGVPHLSTFGALLASYHNGTIFEVTNNKYPSGNVTEANATHILSNVSYAMNLFVRIMGAPPRYVCVAGPPEGIPFIINESILIAPPSLPAEHPASDNYYGDLDGDAIHPEVAIGRFLALNLVEACKQLNRYVDYNSYFIDDELEVLPAWQNGALVFTGEGSETGLPSSEHAVYVLYGGDFVMYQTHSTLASNTMSPFSAQQLIEKSNFIWMGDHGNENEIISVDFSKLNCKPSVLFAASCTTGKTDGVDRNISIAYAAINSGLATYIAPTRIAEAGYTIGYNIGVPPIDVYEFGCDPLATYFFERLIKDNVSVGIALKEAKSMKYIEEYGVGGTDSMEDILQCYIFTLYGDPAFNPYEPCNEGST
jgi:hypothetical protein